MRRDEKQTKQNAARQQRVLFSRARAVDLRSLTFHGGRYRPSPQEIESSSQDIYISIPSPGRASLSSITPCKHHRARATHAGKQHAGTPAKPPPHRIRTSSFSAFFASASAFFAAAAASFSAFFASASSFFFAAACAAAARRRAADARANAQAARRQMKHDRGRELTPRHACVARFRLRVNA